MDSVILLSVLSFSDGLNLLKEFGASVILSLFHCLYWRGVLLLPQCFFLILKKLKLLSDIKNLLVPENVETQTCAKPCKI